MLVAYLGEPAFKEGMRLYVRRHKWGNAATGHLWAALEESSGKPVRSMMNCWTKQTGCGTGKSLHSHSTLFATSDGEKTCLLKMVPFI